MKTPSLRTFFLLGFLAGLIVGSSGCDGTAAPGETTDAGKTDALPPVTYTRDGNGSITTNLGPDPCNDKVKHPECFTAANYCGWNPTTNTCTVAYFQAQDEVICDATLRCTPGTYAAGTVLSVTVHNDHLYLGSSGLAGYLCTPNKSTLVRTLDQIYSDQLCPHN